MMYQLEHDRSLNAIKPFKYEETGEILTGVSIWLRFDTIFKEKESDATIVVDGERKSLNELVKVSFDNFNKTFLFSNSANSYFSYEIVSYSKAVAEKEESEIARKVNKLMNTNVPMSYDTPIEKSEFDFIIEKYGTCFENDSSLQTLAIGWHEM